MNVQLANEVVASSQCLSGKDRGKRKKKRSYVVRLRRRFLRLHPRERLYALLTLAFILLIGIGIVWGLVAITTQCSHERTDDTSSITGYVNPTQVDLEYPFVDSYCKAFDDLNDLHLQAAKKYGIDPEKVDLKTELGLQGMLLVESDSLIMVNKLYHSVPYLVQEAYYLLHDISLDFARRLKFMDIPRHRLIVTSLTRTEEQRAALQKVNSNASKNSAHCYGTTFDISWSRFDPIEGKEVSDAILKKHLAAIIKQYQQAGRCYIKHERRQACFHITVIGHPLPQDSKKK